MKKSYRHLKFSKLKSMFWDTLYIYMYSLVILKVIDRCLETSVHISHIKQETGTLVLSIVTCFISLNLHGSDFVAIHGH